ncbi:MAG: hypothetical protein RBU30_02225 [Polyangia bacterium]|jgi:hypothetical protein|nr:hypothetical protein [Polyangia bacterium]
MKELIKDIGQSALDTGERLMRLVWDGVAVVVEQLREVTGQTRPMPMERPAEPWQAQPVRQAGPVAPKSETKKPQAASRGSAKAKAKAKKKPAAKGAGDKERADQMIRVLELLAESGNAWQSAKELSDAGAAAGTPILPGNVRKVIRARGGDLIETRPRDGSRRGALEYRLTEAGRRTLGS